MRDEVDNRATRQSFQQAVDWVMPRTLISSFAIAVLAVCPGCQRTTPVEEITVSAGSVKTVAATAAESELLASQWPTWRGFRNDGVAPDNAGVREGWDDSSIVWQAPIAGRGHSSPIVYNDLVMLATAEDGEQKQSVLAFDRETGKPRWSKVIHEGNFPARGEVHNKATNANGTLACDGKRVYTVFLNGGKIVATALDLKGEKVWDRELGSFNSKFGYAPSPILYRSLVLVAADNRGGGYLSALDGETGKIVWRKKRPAISTYSSPFVANVGGKDQLVISGCNLLCSYDPLTGEKNWEADCIAEATCGTVVTDGERFFASGGYPQKQTVCVSASGEILWDNSYKLYEPSMICLDGMLVGFSDRGVAYGWDCESGKLHWQERIGGSFSASPVAINGLLYVSDLGGSHYVFRATPKGLEEVAENRLGNDCYASPATADGQIFLRIGFGQGGQRQEKLVCISAKESAE